MSADCVGRFALLVDDRNTPKGIVMAMGHAAWKIMGPAAAVLAGILATKVVNLIWARAGQDEINPKHPDAPLAKAVTYAAITGLAVGIARTFTESKAAELYAKSAGHLPDAIREEPV